jgi:hypothetical protein
VQYLRARANVDSADGFDWRLGALCWDCTLLADEAL